MLRDPIAQRSDLASAVHTALVRDGSAAVPHDRASIAALVRAHDPLAPSAEIDEVVERVMARTVGLGPLDVVLADPDVSEVMVNGDGRVWIESNGTLTATSLSLDRTTTTHVIEKIVAPLGLRADRVSALVDARLPDGSRVNVVIPPLAVDGPCLTIRRFVLRDASLPDLCSKGVAALLEWAVAARLNIVVTGGTGAGKTTLLNALAGAIPNEHRVVTVEDAAELDLPGHVVRLEARPSTADGLGAVTVRDLVRNALRMRPDRIVVGEVRGPEALDMLQAMNTGHEGSLSTCHANSPADALRRIETMVLMGDVALPLHAVREQVTASLDLVVHIARTDAGSRRVTAVAEVSSGDEGTRPEVRALTRDGELVRLPSRPARYASIAAPDEGWLSCG